MIYFSIKILFIIVVNRIYKEQHYIAPFNIQNY